MNKMNTPIADFVERYAQSDVSRFHMPGHKGVSFLGCEALDITEISGADVLGSASGIIAQSEQNATSLFGTRHTFYSTEGSSLAIKAMLALIKKSEVAGVRTKILAARNAHKAFIYACALLDLDVDWIYPAEVSHLCSCEISPSELDGILSSASPLPSAVYITTPDYLGKTADVKGISDICHKHGLPLLVDNAHGAYLAFLSPSKHPIALGADMCCDSAHKTLPVLTGGAYLHVSNQFNRFEESDVRNAMSLFASTSPSYLILQSLDLCNRYLSDGYFDRLGEFIKKVERIKARLEAIGFPPEKTEPLKIVFSRGLCHYSGTEIADALSKFKIELEFADENSAVLMLSPELKDTDLDRLLRAIVALKEKASTRASSDIPALIKPVSAISIREAMLSASETISVDGALGKICATPNVSCPPAIPIVVSGELIDEPAIRFLKYYGIEKIDVVKQ